MTRLSQTHGLLRPFPPASPPLSPRAAASSDAGAETEFLESFGKMLIIYGDFSPCPAAALRGPETLNENIVYFRADLIYSGSGVNQAGMKGDGRPASQLPSPAPRVAVELVAALVVPDVRPQAQRQAAVALTGQVGAPGALSCGTRGAQDQPRLWGE